MSYDLYFTNLRLQRISSMIIFLKIEQITHSIMTKLGMQTKIQASTSLLSILTSHLTIPRRLKAAFLST